jgi:hypothetical protein
MHSISTSHCCLQQDKEFEFAVAFAMSALMILLKVRYLVSKLCGSFVKVKNNISSAWMARVLSCIYHFCLVLIISMLTQIFKEGRYFRFYGLS